MWKMSKDKSTLSVTDVHGYAFEISIMQMKFKLQMKQCSMHHFTSCL